MDLRALACWLTDDGLDHFADKLILMKLQNLKSAEEATPIHADHVE